MHSDGETAQRQKRRRVPCRAFLYARSLTACTLQAARLDIIAYNNTTLSAEHTNTNRDTPDQLSIYTPPRDCPAWCFPRSSAFLSQRSATQLCRMSSTSFIARAHTNDHPVCPRLHLPPLSHRAHLPHTPLQQSISSFN